MMETGKEREIEQAIYQECKLCLKKKLTEYTIGELVEELALKKAIKILKGTAKDKSCEGCKHFRHNDKECSICSRNRPDRYEEWKE